MKLFDYRFFSHSKIVSGSCALETIPAELESYDARKPLVITGKDITRRGLEKKLIRAFYDSGFPLGGIYDEVRDYAGIGLAQEAAHLFRERGCDSLISLGSGPITDTARAVNILVSDASGDPFRFFDGTPLAIKMKPMVLIPTCCSGGLEAGNIITLDNRQFQSDSLYPDVVILDKRMTPACSSRCAAESAVLAMDNAISALMDSKSNPMNDAFIHASLQFISQNLAKSMRRPKNKKISLAMANAGVMAGIAASNAGPGLVRLLSEELSRSTGLSRGVFTAMLLPSALVHREQQPDPLNGDLLLALKGMDVFSGTPERKRSSRGIESALDLIGMTKKIIPETLSALNIPYYKLEDAAEKAAARSHKTFSSEDCLAVMGLSRQVRK